MNIFPTRKTIDTYNQSDYKNYTNSENTVIPFPNPQIYQSLNEKLLKSYLKITNKNVIEKKNLILQLEENIYNINTSIHINDKSYELFIFEADQTKSLREHLDYIHDKNFYLIFDLFDFEYVKEIGKTNKIGEIHIKEIIKLIFLNLMNVQLIPNFCNLWIFGQQNSIVCQGTYLPLSEKGFSDEDYLDLITNVVVKSYLKLDEKSVYNAIDINKSNEQLFFLAFK